MRVKIWTDNADGFKIQIGDVRYMRTIRTYRAAVAHVRREKAARKALLCLAEWTGPVDPYEESEV